MADIEKIETGIFEMLQRCSWDDIDKERHRFQPVLNNALKLLKEQHETIKSLEQEIRDKNVRLTERAEQVEHLLKKSVPQSVVDQIKWERDTALSQLEEIGKGLGEKMDDVKPKWIPVIARAPQEGKIVLVVTPEYTDEEGNEYTKGVQCGYWLFPQDPTWFSSDGVTYGNGGRIVNPTHWMELPEPPKDGE